MVDFIWNQMPIVNFIIALLLVVAIHGLAFFILFKVAKRKVTFAFYGVCTAIFFIGFIFNLLTVCIMMGFISAACMSAAFFANLGDLRKFIANPFSRPVAKAGNFGIEKIYDTQFEKNTDLKDIMKNGVPVHAPVTPEILMTIFYPGTRLHDGAVVIHGNEIVAASVFFTPTTKPFAGKYGSRHRAAIGVSEVSDAVTVVVSEETGRISFAVNGDLEAVNQTNFRRVFETYMSDNSSEE